MNHAHVHFAMKLSRLNGAHKRHRAYLVKLMAPYSTMGNFNSPLTVCYRAEPKIVAQRFILHSKWQFLPDLGPVKLESLPCLEICPHLTFLNFLRDHSMNPRVNSLTASITAAFKSSPAPQFSACYRCPADFEIQVENGQMGLWIWQDLGSGASPLDPEWRIHVWTYHNNDFRGPMLPHVPGSLRRTY